MTTHSKTNSRSTTKTDIASPDLSALSTRFSAAYARRAHLIAATPEDSLLQVNLDVPTGITSVLAAVPRIHALRPAISKALRDFDLDVIDGLEDDALALGEAHMAWLTAATTRAALPELNTEAIRRRDRLYLHAEALVDAGELPRAKIEEIKANAGYRGVAFELLSLCRLFRESWASIQGKTAVKVADLTEAQDVADRLLEGVTVKQTSTKVDAAIALTRQKAFTRLIARYDEVRRAVAYLRWHEGDLDQIAPSLYAGRGNGNHKKADTAKSDVPPPAKDPASPPSPPAPTAAHGMTPTAAVPVTTAPHGSSTPIAQGLPGASPYLT